MIESIRGWLRSDMLVWRWVFLALYLVLVVSITLHIIVDSGELFILIWLGVLVGAQALFIFGGGTIHLCRPIRRRRLLLPVVVASFMLMVLLVGLVIAMSELLRLDEPEAVVFWVLVGGSWTGWGVLLFIHTQRMQRFRALSRMSSILIAGSLAELLAAVPSHLVVSRRPGCLVGIGTMIGVIAGLGVLLFSFGPAIALLFLRPRYRRERMEGVPYCETCGYDLRASAIRCPECGTPIERQISV